MNNQFHNKSVWITGASSGIGEALAIKLSQLGARLILSARNMESLNRVKSLCENSEKHIVCSLDLSSVSLANDISAYMTQLPTIDVLINNAGISQRSLALETDSKTVKKIMDVDFFGTVELTNAVARQMVEQQGGLIVNISSIAGKLGTPYRSAYAAAKHALIGYMDSLRSEVAANGIRVVVVCPGFVKTKVSVNALVANGQPYGKMDDEVGDGMSAKEFAERFVKALNKSKNEIIIADGLPKFGHHFRRLFPNWFHRFMMTQYRKSV